MLYEGADGNQSPPPALFTNNESNLKKLFNVVNSTPYVKDAFHRYVVNGESTAVNPDQQGTKAAPHFKFSIPAGQSKTVRLRLIDEKNYQTAVKEQKLPTNSVGVGADFESVFAARLSETDDFYTGVLEDIDGDDAKQISRQGYAGLLWSKQFYFYSVRDWLVGDPSGPKPPGERRHGRNSEWAHLYNRDVISMPDKMGVSMVRRLGSGLPHGALWPNRYRIRQTTAAAVLAGVVHAPQRPDSGLRI